MDVPVVLSELVDSIIANNADDKIISIIFLYAGGAHNELIICNELIVNGFIIENIYFHDRLYDDLEMIDEIRRMFAANDHHHTALHFSQKCNNIEDISVNRCVAKRRCKRNPICIACNPQIIGGLNQIIDINMFIQRYFIKNSFIYTVVLNRIFYLYTKDEHNLCIDSNVGIQHVDKHCFFEKIDALIENNAGKTRRRRRRRRNRKQKTRRNK